MSSTKTDSALAVPNVSNNLAWTQRNRETSQMTDVPLAGPSPVRVADASRPGVGGFPEVHAITWAPISGPLAPPSVRVCAGSLRGRP